MLFSFRLTGEKEGGWCKTGHECVTVETDWWTVADRCTALSPLCLSFPTKRGNCRHQAERFLLVVQMYLKSHFRTRMAVCYRRCLACSLHVKCSKLLGNLIFLFFLFFFFFCGYVYVIHACMCACLQVYMGHMYVKTSVTLLSWGSCWTQNSPILISLTRWLADLSQQLAPGIPPLFLSSARIQACCTCWEFM